MLCGFFLIDRLGFGTVGFYRFLESCGADVLLLNSSLRGRGVGRKDFGRCWSFVELMDYNSDHH